MSKTIRNPIVVAMGKRYGKTTSIMGDRRAPRGGSRNHMREYLNDLEDVELSTEVESQE